jgi:hypothetical protein
MINLIEKTLISNNIIQANSLFNVCMNIFKFNMLNVDFLYFISHKQLLLLYNLNCVSGTMLNSGYLDERIGENNNELNTIFTY